MMDGAESVAKTPPVTFERFTDRARGVVRLATKHALACGYDEVYALALLRGVLEDGTGVGASVLKNIGVFQSVLDATATTDPVKVEYKKIPFSRSGEATLRHAKYTAESLGCNYVGTEHILLGAVFTMGEFARDTLKISYDAVLTEVKRLMGEWEKSSETTVPEPSFVSIAQSLAAKAATLPTGSHVTMPTTCGDPLSQEELAKVHEPREVSRRRLAIVRIGESEILDAMGMIFSGVIGAAVYKAEWLDRLPKDAVIVRVGHDFASRQFELMVEHPSFDVVLDGAIPPILTDRLETQQVRFVSIKSTQDNDRIAELQNDNRRLRLELGRLVDERNAGKADEPVTLTKEPSGSYVGADRFRSCLACELGANYTITFECDGKIRSALYCQRHCGDAALSVAAQIKSGVTVRRGNGL